MVRNLCMEQSNYIKGFIHAYSKYKIASPLGTEGAGTVGDIGSTPGQPSDQEKQRRLSTIDRAFATNENLPGADSSTPESANRSP